MTGASFPRCRPRRLRRFPGLGTVVRETRLASEMLVAPLFVADRLRRPEPVPSMPGVFRLPLEQAAEEARILAGLRIGGVLLFGIPARKDEKGSGAFDPGGIVQRAVRGIKKAAPELVVMTDVCLCEYTSHGHCGLVRRGAGSVDNDATLPVLGRVALSQAKAGADLVAPSAMMDGQVQAIRRALDEGGFQETPIMSYSAKYASALYGPFREAVGSAPRFGSRRGYQMDPPNLEEALRETALDIEEGADIVMVKPALGYLDVVRAVKERFHWPTAAFSVSGEYALIRAAAAKGWVEEERLVLELAAGIARAGADLIISYDAKRIAQWLKGRKG